MFVFKLKIYIFLIRHEYLHYFLSFTLNYLTVKFTEELKYDIDSEQMLQI